MFQRKAACPGCRVGCQYVIDIVESLVIRLDPLSFHRKRQPAANFYFQSVKVYLRTLEITPGAGIIAQLAVMVEAILKRRAAALAETPFPDLSGILILNHLLADAISDIRIAAVYRQICGQGVVSIDDHLHIRSILHDAFQDIHSNINLPIPVQLVSE